MTPHRRARALLAVACAGGALYGFAGPAGAQKGAPAVAPVAPATATGAAAGAAAADRGRALFVLGCSSCHGLDARGVAGRGPSLYGVGAAAADFYLATGRMPLADPREEPTRAHPQYSRSEIAALVAYVASLAPGPPIPRVDPAAGRLNRGMAAFALNCSGCHEIGGAGGIVTGAIAPALDNPDVTPTELGEAVRVGPYVMPVFGPAQISEAELDDIARYVVSTQHPADAGGWGIGHIGPIPEGMVAWFLGAASLVLVARLIGERNPS
jgi:ubiquinol-cytochrome c reductase cytochrome c subunit